MMSFASSHNIPQNYSALYPLIVIEHPVGFYYYSCCPSIQQHLRWYLGSSDIVD